MEGKRIKWGNVIIFLLIVAAGVAAFSYKNYLKNLEIPGMGKVQESSGTKKGPLKPGTPRRDTFLMGLDSWIGGTPALIALSREYHKDYSLDLELMYIPNDEDRIQALKDGKIQGTEMSLPAFIRFTDKYPNAGLIVGITDFSRGADGIVAKTEIQDLNDLEGRRVSYVGDGTGKFVLNKFLRLTGLRYQDIRPTERLEMEEVVDDLKAGRADLIVSWSPDMNLAVKEVNNMKPNSARILISTKEVPDLVPTVLVVNKDFYQNNPDKVLAFLKTWYISSKYILEKPQRAYEKLTGLMLERKDEYGEVAVEDVKESFSNIKLMSLNDNFDYFGITGPKMLLEGIMTDTVQTWRKYGDISKNVEASDIMSAELMEQLAKEGDKELMVGILDSGVTGNAEQPAEVKKEFKKQDDASIEKTTEKVAKIDIPPVYYDSGRASVKSESVAVLNEVLDILRQFPEYYLIIDAHTDSIGSDEFNLKLSKDRAAEVKAYLVNQGVDVNRIVARGWGKYRLVVPNEVTEEDRARNRRTEFILTRDKAQR